MAMTQNKRAKYESIFEANLSPELLTICYQNHHVARLPRVMHRHDDRMEILFIQQGDGDYLVNGEKYKTTTGDILIYNSGVLHDECHVSDNASDKIMIYSCSVSGLKLKGLPLNHLIAPHQDLMIKCGDYQDDIENLFLLLFRQVKSYRAYQRELTNYLLRSLLVMIYDLSRLGFKRVVAPTDDILGRRIQHYLDEHYQQDISLTIIAQELNVSKFYLAHIFKSFSGYSPMQYLIRRRIGEAQTLLLHSQCSVTDIAYLVGYNSMSHFQQTFLKMVGMPPHKYRCFILDKERRDYLVFTKPLFS